MCLYCMGVSIESSDREGSGRRRGESAGAGSAASSAADWSLAPDACSRIMIGICVPDTEMAYCASKIMQRSGTPSLYNHCVRTYLLGMFDAGRRQLDVDEEVVFISSMLHGLALTETRHGDPQKTFEENSADFARRFVMEGGFSAERAEKVARGILHHADSHPDPDPDVALVMIGARQDVYGPAADELSKGLLQAIENEVPRLDFKRSFVDTLKKHVARSEMPTWTASFSQTPPAAFYDNRWSE